MTTFCLKGHFAICLCVSIKLEFDIVLIIFVLITWITTRQVIIVLCKRMVGPFTRLIATIWKPWMYDACIANLLLHGDWGSHLGQTHFSKGPTIFLLLFHGLLMNWVWLQAIPSFSWCKWITSVAEQVHFRHCAVENSPNQALPWFLGLMSPHQNYFSDGRGLVINK